MKKKKTDNTHILPAKPPVMASQASSGKRRFDQHLLACPKFDPAERPDRVHEWIDTAARIAMEEEVPVDVAATRIERHVSREAGSGEVIGAFRRAWKATGTRRHFPTLIGGGYWSSKPYEIRRGHRHPFLSARPRKPRNASNDFQSIAEEPSAPNPEQEKN